MIFLIPFVDKTLVLVAKVFLVINEKIETKKYYRMVGHVQEIIEWKACGNNTCGFHTYLT